MDIEAFEELSIQASRSPRKKRHKRSAHKKPPQYECEPKPKREQDLRVSVKRPLDYTTNFVLSGNRSANYLQNAPESSDRFPGYPRLSRLDQLKRELIDRHSHVPLGLSYLWSPTQHCSSLREALGYNRFDVILLNVPRHAAIEQMQDLRIDEICSAPSFIFLAIPDSSADNLDKGRVSLQQWGFRRAEEIIWIKTSSEPTSHLREDRSCLFVNVKEHCLMGVKGTVRRSIDSRLIHCNMDTDVIVADEFDNAGRRQKPEELYNLIENFCQGLRRLEIFCSRQRRGWVTVAADIQCSNYDPYLYRNMWQNGHLLPTTQEIEALRPKTPPLDKTRSKLTMAAHHSPDFYARSGNI